MRKMLLVSLCSLGLVYLSAQEIIVPQTQRPLIVKRTASWCSLCGGWGWNFFRALQEENQSKAVLWANHYNGIYTNPTTTAIATNFGGVSQPVFFLNNQNQNVNSGNTSNALANIRNQVDAAYSSQPVVQSGIRMSIQGGQTLIAQAKARFFQQTSGEFYLGIYLVRSTFTGFQAGQGNNAEHKEVLWGHLTPTVFGSLIGNGTIQAGTEATVEGQIPLNGLDPLTLRVVTVIWRKQGDTYNVVNANESTTYSQPTNTEEQLPEGLSSIKLFPNSAIDHLTLSLTAEQSLETDIALFSVSGKLMKTIFRGRLDAGEHAFRLNRDNIPSGIYLVKTSIGGRSHISKIVFQ